MTCPQGRFTVAPWTSAQTTEMNRDKPAALRASGCLLDGKLLRKVSLVVVLSGSATRSQNSVSVSSESLLGLNGTGRQGPCPIAATSCYTLQT